MTLSMYASPRRRSLSVERRGTFADGVRCNSGRSGSGGRGNVDASRSGPSWQVAFAVTPPL
jgi:hypothetical protein